MIDFRAIGLGIVLPAAVTGGALAAAARFPPRFGGLFAGLGLAGGMCAGYFALGLGPFWYWPPGDHWLPHLTILAIPAACVAARSRVFGNVLAVTLFTGIAGNAVIVKDSLRMQLFWGVALGYASLLSALMLIYCRVSGTRTAVAMALISAAAGYVCLESGPVRLAQMAGLLLASCAAAAVVFAALDRDPDKPLACAVAPGFALLLTALTFSAYQSPGVDVPPKCYAVLMAAPITLIVTRVPAFERLPRIMRVTVPFMLLALPLAIAMRCATPA